MAINLMVSIIMPAYNSAKTILSSIDSVLAQTYENWELIIIDDASSDDISGIVKRISELDARVHYYANEVNLGVAETRNRGISLASSDWIAFLDSDDLWHRNKLEKQMIFISKTGATITYTGTSYMNETGSVSSYVLHAQQNLSYKTLLRGNIMSCSSIVIRKDCMIPFPHGDMHEDYTVWLQILGVVGYAYGLDEPLLIYRMSAHSKSAGRFHSAQMTYNAYRHVGYGNLISLLFTLRYAFHSILKRSLIRFGWIKSQIKSVPFTLKSYIYSRILPKLKPSLPIQINTPADETSQPSIAVICDAMTWKNLCQEYSTVSLTPHTWKTVLSADAKKKIRFLFCEATWGGTSNSCWRGQVYKDKRVFYENRRELLEILKRCNSEGIPTVFWAKEDPVYFQDEIYDFTDTALRFDYILTTAVECIPKYHALGHQNVYVWPFGFSPEIYYPPKNPEITREVVAVFAGSWFEDHPLRCRDLTEIFDMLLDADIPLRIYDRNRVDGNSTKPFPAKYQLYIRDSIPYEELGDIYREVEFVINVNTVRTSNTMFARRIYEAMACGCIVVSNESLGIRQQFGDNLWYVGENFDFERSEYIRQRNIESVFSSHTWGHRMEQLFELIKVGKEPLLDDKTSVGISSESFDA